ncbi:Cysteinyl-tRNA synthetase [Candidatus Mycoplasma haematolamae str. Purdue]|uniref:Cysteinyl-tRNA synthetase n=1 Tax=Mycoplasma haematolamae (strain Purdue) TaxID=1212765 RepID=I7BIM8_MYCHA|nr:class I tRNA ligase family protein [Candidatus Mycoplasma haematolamae]AFO51678.1 Cysteinyl-tRNA synthetase [Candidatus Mycoplasma haematolamae str. Purdue]
MKLYLHDSLGDQRKYLPEKEKITIYVCGPTLYNKLHLGNLRPIVTFDFLIRYLRELKIPYQYVQNLTDIDEKILNKAFKERREVKEITAEYTEHFYTILRELNIILPDIMPSVSENLSEIFAVIETLLNTGKAIWDKNTQSIKFLQPERDKTLNYFSPEGLSEADEADFVLWKENNKTPFCFCSPWFEGIPGWHIECFAMMQKYFEFPLTIHGGGVDLKFPHHENVNLMSRSVFNREIANIWVHIGQVLNEQGKLSKSSNYSWTVDECAEKFSWNFLRYIFMKAKYHKPLTVTQQALDLWWSEWKSYEVALNYSEVTLLTNRLLSLEEFSPISNPDRYVIEQLEANLNLPEIVSWLEKLKLSLLSSIKDKNFREIRKLRDSLEYHLKWLGFKVPKLSTEDRMEAEEWFSLLSKKDYKNADVLRGKLVLKGILP